MRGRDRTVRYGDRVDTGKLDPDARSGVVTDQKAPDPATLTGPAPAPPVEDPASDSAGSRSSFHVRLTNFEGPFDLLLQLISKHQLDVTEVALHQVTDDFIAHIKAMGDTWDLNQATEFLLIAATLLDLKAARLLPAASVEDEEDLALLEARDLLFARLLQYRAYKQVSAWLGDQFAVAGRRYPRSVTLEPRFAQLMPEVLLGIEPAQFARIAVEAMTPKVPPTVMIDHIHAPKVSVREHAAILRDRLVRLKSASFRALCSDCANTLEIVARFLALLELYREGVLGFDQAAPLADLQVRWVGDEAAQRGMLTIDEYDETSAPAQREVGAQTSDDAANDDAVHGADGEDNQRENVGIEQGEPES